MKFALILRFPWLFLTLLLILGGGCRSQTPRFYTLSSLPPEPRSTGSPTSAAHAGVGLGPIKLADYLDQSRLITRTGDHQLLRAEFERWAGSFKDNCLQVLADNIGYLLPTDRIYLFPWRLAVPIDYQVVLDILKCEGRLGDTVWLEARWTVLRGPEKKLHRTKRSSIREPVTGPDYADLVAAQSRALGHLSYEIVQAIKGTGEVASNRDH